MVERVREKMEAPIKMGNAIAVLIVGVAVIGLIFIGSIKLMADNVVNLPQQNKADIADLKLRSAVQDECIQTLKSDVKEIKEGTAEIQKDIKDLLKRGY